MEKKFMNKLDDMELDMVAGGRCNPGGSKKRPRPSFHDSNANSMAANIMGATENANAMAAKGK